VQLRLIQGLASKTDT